MPSPVSWALSNSNWNKFVPPVLPPAPDLISLGPLHGDICFDDCSSNQRPSLGVSDTAMKGPTTECVSCDSTECVTATRRLSLLFRSESNNYLRPPTGSLREADSKSVPCPQRRSPQDEWLTPSSQSDLEEREREASESIESILITSLSGVDEGASHDL
jgi:hypothetical protein